MSKHRYHVSSSRQGTRTIEDRKTGAWYLVKAGRIIDYGMRRETPLLHLDALNHELAMGFEGGD